MIIENLSTLKIHKLTQAQYNRELANGTIDENALYLTPDEAVDLSNYATIEQLNDKADANHTHDDYALKSEFESLEATVDEKIAGIDFSDYQTVANAITQHNELKAYTDSEVAKVTSGTIIIKESEHAKSATEADTSKNAEHAVDADSATKATQDASGNVITSTYETKADASAKLDAAKSYADSAAANVKNELLNGAGDAYDTLKELGELIDDNTDAITVLNDVAASKADKEHIHAIEDITGLKPIINEFNEHTHSWNDLTDKPFGDIVKTRHIPLYPETEHEFTIDGDGRFATTVDFNIAPLASEGEVIEFVYDNQTRVYVLEHWTVVGDWQDHNEMCLLGGIPFNNFTVGNAFGCEDGSTHRVAINKIVSYDDTVFVDEKYLRPFTSSIETLVNETTVEIEDYNGILNPFGIEIEDGASYIVTFDRVPYECTGKSLGGNAFVLGDELILSGGFGEKFPFVIFVNPDSSVRLISEGNGGQHTISISKINIKINENCLPYEAAIKTEVDEALANKSDINHTHSISEVADLQSTIDSIQSNLDSIESAIDDIPTIPTNVSAFTNDAGYISAIPSEYVTETELSAKGYITSIPSEYITESELNAKKYLTSIPSEYVTESELTAKGYATQSSLDSHIGNDLHITSAERSKLSGIAAGAQVNTITGVKGNDESSYRTGNVNITKANIGLGNVDNTSDVNKPVSTAQQTAIDSVKSAANKYTDNAIANLLNNSTEAVDSIYELRDAMEDNADAITALQRIASSKADASALTSHTGDKSNPHGVTAAQVGALSTTGGAMTGAIDFTGSSQVMDFGTTGYFRGTTSSGNKFDMFALVNSTKLRVGGTYPSLELFGKEERPTYNGSNVALQSDVPTDYATSTHSHSASEVGAYTTSEIDVKVNSLQSSINDKAAKSTTLSGYGITNAYTKSEVDAALSNKVDSSTLSSHTGNTTVHITSTERSNWNAAKSHADTAHAPSNAEKNQNAFSNVIVGNTTIAADTTTDSLTLIAGSNVTLTPDATNDNITIAAKDTVYTHPTYTSKSNGFYKITVDGTGHVSGTAAVAKSDITALGIPAQDTTYGDATTSASGLMSSGDKTKLNGIATGAEVNQNAFSNVVVGSTTISADSKTDSLTLIAGSNVTLTPNATDDSVTIAATDTVYTHPTTSGNKHIPAGGSSGQVLKWSADGTATWGTDNDTTYSAGTGISLSGTTFSNSGVRAISTGTANGTISVNTNGSSADVAVKGLGSAAYTDSTAYASKSQYDSLSSTVSAQAATITSLTNRIAALEALVTSISNVDIDSICGSSIAAASEVTF